MPFFGCVVGFQFCFSGGPVGSREFSSGRARRFSRVGTRGGCSYHAYGILDVSNDTLPGAVHGSASTVYGSAPVVRGLTPVTWHHRTAVWLQRSLCQQFQPMSITYNGYLAQPYGPQLDHQHGEVSVGTNREPVVNRAHNSSWARVSSNTEQQMDEDTDGSLSCASPVTEPYGSPDFSTRPNIWGRLRL